MIPADTELYRALEDAATTRRCLVFAGLPGIGKSLLTGEAMRIAQAAGRPVSLLQWDAVRRDCFEIAPFIERYPEQDGVTHPIVRLAVDCWVRTGIARWLADGTERALLVIEAPLLGGRMVSLVRPTQDDAETLLASDQSLFLLPVPTVEVKQALRRKRQASQDIDPGQPDAALNVLDGLVEEVNAAALSLGVAKVDSHGYVPDLYAAVFLHAMRHRHCLRLSIDQVFAADAKSARPPLAPATLHPSLEEVTAAFTAAEAIPPAARRLDTWYL